MPLIDVKVPNIGDFDNVPVVEIQVKVGDEVKVDDPLITLESDKAAMDVPSPEQGKVAEVLVGVGDKVSEGSTIIRLDVSSMGKGKSQSKVDSDGGEASVEASAGSPANLAAVTTAAPPQQAAKPKSKNNSLPAPKDFGSVHASPSVRRTARELDVDLTKITGTGDKGRITKDDVKSYIARSEGGGGLGIPEEFPRRTLPNTDLSRPSRCRV